MQPSRLAARLGGRHAPSHPTVAPMGQRRVHGPSHGPSPSPQARGVSRQPIKSASRRGRGVGAGGGGGRAGVQGWGGRREPERYGKGDGCAAAPLHGAPCSAGRAYEAAVWLHGLLWPRFYVAPSRGSGWPTRRRGDEGEWVGGHAASIEARPRASRPFYKRIIMPEARAAKRAERE